LFFLPALLIPLAFVFACVRLCIIPVNLRAGRSRLKAEPTAASSVGFYLAYLGLLVYSLALAAFAGRVVFTVGLSTSQFGEAFVFLAAYPLACVAAEWFFYHGLTRAKPGSGHVL